MKPTVSTPRNTIIDQKPNRPMLAEATAHGNRKATSRSKMMKRIGDEVEAHVELHARIVEGVEAALVGRELLRIGIVDGDHERRRHQREGDEQRHTDEDGDRQVVVEELIHGGPLSRRHEVVLRRNISTLVLTQPAPTRNR